MPTGAGTDQARVILDSLEESGQPPKYGARRLNVGTESVLTELKRDYLQDRLLAVNKRDGRGSYRFAVGEYGNGKTQFLRCLQEEAWDLGFVTAFVELSQDECPLDKPERVFCAVTRSLQARPESLDDVDRERGIESCLQQLLDRMFPGVLKGMPEEGLRQEALHWIDHTLSRTPVESASVRTAVAALLRGRITGDSTSVQLAADYLSGVPVPLAQLGRIRVYERLDKSNGMRFLRSLSQLLQRSELSAGLVLLFDEARRVLSLMSVRAQQLACENLLTVINRCNSGEFPGTLFVYAVMTDFFVRFADHYPALQQRCGQSTRIDLNHLDGIDEIDLLVRIGEKIAAVHRELHGDGAAQIIEPSLRVLAEEAFRQTHGNGTRRAFVRACVQALKRIQNEGKPLDADAANELLQAISN